jgi:hypothetical protein
MNQATEQSSRSLLLAIVIAFALAACVAVCFVLPAEYGIDPTGIGKQLGLTKLVPSDEEPVATAQEDTAGQTIEITVPAGKGVEYKFAMQQYDKMHYEWLSDGAVLYFDLHGEPEGDTSGYFESYAIATLDQMKGSFTAPFTGSHGWYWKNKSDAAVSIQLQVKGQFDVIGLKQ